MPTVASVVEEVAESDEYEQLVSTLLFQSTRSSDFPAGQQELKRLRETTDFSDIPKDDFDEIVERAQQRDTKRDLKPQPFQTLLNTIETEPQEMELFESVFVDFNGSDEYVEVKKDAEEYLTVGVFPPYSEQLKLGVVYRTTTSPWELVAFTQPENDIHLAAIDRDFLQVNVQDFASKRLNRFIFENEEVIYARKFDDEPGIGNTNFPCRILDATYDDEILDQVDLDSTPVIDSDFSLQFPYLD